MLVQKFNVGHNQNTEDLTGSYKCKILEYSEGKVLERVSYKMANSIEMCDNIRGLFGRCGHRAVVYIARCQQAIRNGVTCPPGQREDADDWQEDDDNGFCPACKGETPQSPESPQRYI